MPLLYIDLIEGREPAEIRTLLDAIHDAVVEAFAVPPRGQERAIGASGDSTYRTRVYDYVRQLDWAPEYNERALSNPFVDGWHGNEAELQASLPEVVRTYQAAVAAEDFEAAAILIGESIGLIHDVRPAADIVVDMADEADRILNRENSFRSRSVQG